MKKIKLLAVNASPRSGNSRFLLEKSIEDVPAYLADTEIERYSFRAKKILPCISCFKCVDNGGCCVIKDDFEELRQMWIKADVIIYSFPVYHLSIPGQLKCFIDRLGNAFYGYYEVTSVRHMKVIGILAQGMHFFGGQELATSTLIHHAVLMNSIPISGDGWHSYTGASGWTHNRMDNKALEELLGEQEPDVEITITAAKSVVKRCIEAAAIIKNGVLSLEAVLAKDPRYGPFLDRLKH